MDGRIYEENHLQKQCNASRLEDFLKLKICLNFQKHDEISRAATVYWCQQL
jgi:hypothetical protein